MKSRQINEKVNFYAPIKIISKGIVNADSDIIGRDVTDFKVDDDMFLEGLASSEQKDLDGQILKPSGFITDYFLKSGFINFNHNTQYSVDSIIGEPVDAKAQGSNFYIKSRLYSWSNLAKSIYSVAQNLALDPNSTRTLSYSVEGMAMETQNDMVSKLLLTGCAIAITPKNSDSYINICKGITVEGLRDIRKELILPPLFTEVNKGVSRDFVFDFISKGKRILVDADFNFEIRNNETEIVHSLSEVQKSIIVLSKAYKEGFIKIEKLEELKKIIKENASKFLNK